MARPLPLAREGDSDPAGPEAARGICLAHAQIRHMSFEPTGTTSAMSPLAMTVIALAFILAPAVAVMTVRWRQSGRSPFFSRNRRRRAARKISSQRERLDIGGE